MAVANELSVSPRSFRCAAPNKACANGVNLPIGTETRGPIKYVYRLTLVLVNGQPKIGHAIAGGAKLLVP